MIVPRVALVPISSKPDDKSPHRCLQAVRPKLASRGNAVKVKREDGWKSLHAVRDAWAVTARGPACLPILRYTIRAPGSAA